MIQFYVVQQVVMVFEDGERVVFAEAKTKIDKSEVAANVKQVSGR